MNKSEVAGKEWETAEEAVRSALQPWETSYPNHIHRHGEPEDRWADQLYFTEAAHPRIEYQLDFHGEVVESTPQAFEEIGKLLSQRLRVTFHQSQLRVAVSALGKQVATITQGLEEVRQTAATLADSVGVLSERVSELEARLQTDPVVDATETVEEIDIDWSRLLEEVDEVASSLGWDFKLKGDTKSREIVVLFPDSQSDLVAETTLDFYTMLSESLRSQTFEEVDFVFEPMSQ